MTYGVFEDLNRRTFADKSFNIAKDRNYYGNQGGLSSMVYKCFDRETSSSGIKNENISNKELAKELRR